MMSPKQLAMIAGEMNAMTAKPDAVITYDSLSDSLWWSDEIPPIGNHRPSDFWCVRPLLRYRMTLILQQPEPDFEEYWIEGMNLFPKWAGFCPFRRHPSLKLVNFYESARSSGMKSIKIDGGE